jgi:hypothetical protein
MAHNPVPWIGLLALVAMFVIPFLPDWIFEGPRTVRHWPRRHVCGACGADWTDGHVCPAGEPEPVLPTRSERLVKRKTALPARALPERERLVGELRRLDR